MGAFDLNIGGVTIAKRKCTRCMEKATFRSMNPAVAK